MPYFPLLSLIQYPIPFLKNNIPNLKKFLLVQPVTVLTLTDDTKTGNLKGFRQGIGKVNKQNEGIHEGLERSGKVYYNTLNI